MPITHAAQVNSIMGDRRFVTDEVTFPNPYVVGGIAITAAEFGLSRIDFLVAIPASTSAAAAYSCQWDRVNSKLVLKATGAASGNAFLELGAVDTSAVKFNLLVIGV